MGQVLPVLINAVPSRETFPDVSRFSWYFSSPCNKRSLAKGFWQKNDSKVTETSEKVTKNKKKWSNSFCRPPFASPWSINCLGLAFSQREPPKRSRKQPQPSWGFWFSEASTRTGLPNTGPCHWKKKPGLVSRGTRIGIIQKGVFGKGVGNSKNASKTRQKYVKWVLFYWEKRNVPKCVRNASISISQTCLPWSDLWVLQRYRIRVAPSPLPRPLRMLKNNSRETYLVPPKGHILVKNMWSESEVVQRYRTRGAPFPIHKAPRMPKNSSKKRTWYQARRHVCAKARLRNPESNCVKNASKMLGTPWGEHFLDDTDRKPGQSSQAASTEGSLKKEAREVISEEVSFFIFSEGLFQRPSQNTLSWWRGQGGGSSVFYWKSQEGGGGAEGGEGPRGGRVSAANWGFFFWNEKHNNVERSPVRVAWHRYLLENLAVVVFRLDIFENPYGAPLTYRDPTPPPPATKKSKNPKIFIISPKVNAISQK